MSRHEQLMSMFNQTQWWADLNEKQRAKLERVITWARKSIRSNEGCTWVANIFRRAAIYLSLDPAESGDLGKWARARKSLDSQGYTLDKCVDEICSLVTLRRQGEGAGVSQLEAVVNNFRQKTARLEELNIDVKKLNPKVLQLLTTGQGEGHSQGCPKPAGGRCECGWLEVERRAMELAPLRAPIAIAMGLEKIQWKDAAGKDRPFQEIYTEINNIGSALEAIDKLPEGEPVVQVGDGAKWVKLSCHGNEYEGKLMGHCGNQGGNRDDTLLSYRVASEKYLGYFEPQLTFIINKAGILGEMKGKNNKKPSSDYHPAIVELLKNPMVKGLSGHGYLSANNFSLNDLSDGLLLELAKARPDLIEYMTKNGDSYQRLSSDRLKVLKGEVKPSDSKSSVKDLEGEDNPLPE